MDNNSIFFLFLINNSIKDMKFLLIRYFFFFLICLHFLPTSCLRQERKCREHFMFERFEFFYRRHKPVVLINLIIFLDIWYFLFFFFFLFLLGYFFRLYDWFDLIIIFRWFFFDIYMRLDWFNSFCFFFFIKFLKIILHE